MAIPSLRLNSGHSIPQLGLGTWQSTPGEVGEAVKTALDVGYRHFDCALIYGNEPEIGKVFADTFRDGKIQLDDIFITSKIWNTYHSYQKATENIDIILKNLQVGYLDLCLIHWPMGYFEEGEIIPKDKDGTVTYSDVDYLETWKAMEAAVRAGKIRSIGLSNFNTQQMQRIIDGGTIKPAVLQVEIHPYFPQNDLLKWCKKHEIIVTAYCPLANNTSMFRKQDDPNLLEEKILLKIAEKHKKTPAQLAIRWAIQRGTVAIPKSVKRTRLEENLNVFDFQLNTDEMKDINSLDRNWRIVTLDRDLKHPHYPFGA